MYYIIHTIYTANNKNYVLNANNYFHFLQKNIIVYCRTIIVHNTYNITYQYATYTYTYSLQRIGESATVFSPANHKTSMFLFNTQYITYTKKYLIIANNYLKKLHTKTCI